MRRLFLLLTLLAGFALPLGAADNPRPEPAPVTDPAQIGDHYRQVLLRPEFQETPELDLDTRVKDWLSQSFTHLGLKLNQMHFASQMHSFSLLLTAVLLLVTITGLLYVILLLFRRRGLRDEAPAAGIPGKKVFLPPEFYDEEIRRATGAGDWHTAWMVAWRQFLSRLEHRQLVETDRTRTNREYLAQLRTQSLPAPTLGLLARMVDAYDHFIYGRKPIGETDWNLFHQQIDEATLQLHLNEKGIHPTGKQAAA